ncbi:MAG: glyceraldehyde-3-phosphate dehydrogenase, partial [Pseudomonadota bacterium]
HPALLQVTDDPIVSSDVRGCPQSLLVDMQATMRAGERLVKVLAWHESLGHAHRIMDVLKLYGTLDSTLKEAS